jgi:hypothetical protein
MQAHRVRFSRYGNDPKYRFDPKGLIHPDTIHDKLARITALRDRSNRRQNNPASITLFACDAGSEVDLPGNGARFG